MPINTETGNIETDKMETEKTTTDKVERLSPGTTKGVRGTYTREDGYMSYYELCQWDTHVDAATQSAVAINGQMWAGLETVDSANVKLDFLIERGMAGLMWWSLDLDDFDGTFCGQGKYPLISGVWRNLQSKLNDAPEVSTTVPGAGLTMCCPSISKNRVLILLSTKMYKIFGS